MNNAPLLDKIRDKAFTPGAKDAKALVELLHSVDREQARDIVRALVRTGPTALGLAMDAAATTTTGPACARCLEVVGKLATPDNEGALALLVDQLGSAHDRVVKVSARALGRLGAKVRDLDPQKRAWIEKALLRATEHASRPDLRSTLIEALGKVGGHEALRMLEESRSDGDTEKASGRAQILLRRETQRDAESSVDAAGVVPSGTSVRFHCREGLEPILLDELGASFLAKRTEPGLVEALLRGPLARVFRARTATHVSLPLVDRARTSSEDLATSVAEELTSTRARALLGALTVGRVRYRLAWAQGGHRRALVFAVAAKVSALEPSFVNDPTRSTWEVIVDEARDRLRIELVPKGLADPRFGYRLSEVPAASHPTLAAALARVGGVQEGDRVWDPFVGSALELVERARLGPYASLAGTDTSDEALVAARANLESAGVTGFTLEKRDARTRLREDITLILTNPPMGRRITPEGKLDELLIPFLAAASSSLVRGGRMVWVTPSSRVTDAAATRMGLVIERALPIDMGGFHAVLQRMVKA